MFYVKIFKSKLPKSHFFAIRHSVTLIQNRNMDGTSMQENHSRGRLCYTNCATHTQKKKNKKVSHLRGKPLK